jgi:hypothetical protein
VPARADLCWLCEKGGVSMSVGDLVRGIERASRAAEAARELIDERWLPEVQQQERASIDAQTRERIEGLRDEGFEQLDQLREQARLERFKAELALAPHDAEGWGQAAARAGFVAADVAAVAQPGDIVDLYKMHQGASDVVGAWLVVREGSKVLSSWTTDEKRGQQAAAREALGQLRELAGLAGIDRTHAKELKYIDELALELGRAVSKHFPEARSPVRF